MGNLIKFVILVLADKEGNPAQSEINPLGVGMNVDALYWGCYSDWVRVQPGSRNIVDLVVYYCSYYNFGYWGTTACSLSI